ncbi:MAG TPA: bifunctional phosphoglucose/phosphomannose isomerase [Verrucomicrobiae bacterium]|jgi:glucose/mannose-6-phosphate isomerase|nr:bifunctional phosphoglucose/phosphomannose isomerase [Verrucomicrobiae bacterium]
MLDDLKLIHERDAQDTLGIAERQWQQLGHAFEVHQDQIEVNNVVYAGMGGSSLAALVSTSWPGHELPFEIVRGYDVPEYVSARTYFIAASYSGNTEETLSALEQAEPRGAKIAVIAGGGKLAEIAKQKNYPLALLPKAEQPRYAVLYNLKALLVLLQQAGLLRDGAMEELVEAADFLKKAVAAWSPVIPTAKNPAKQIAQEVIGKSAVIYAGPKLWPAAYKWKISFNENAKHIAWTDQLPEFNHNEFMGWTKQPVHKPYAVIDLRSKLEHPRVQKRFEVTERLLSGMRPAPIVVDAQGSTLLEQLLWTIAFGDFVTIYTALLNGLNPAPVDLIEKFKKSLDE